MPETRHSDQGNGGAISQDKVVAIDYTLRSDAGEVIDSSNGRQPLTYLHGHGNIIPGLEKALEGKREGDSATVKVSPEEGYGVRDDRLVTQVPRSQFSGVDKIEKGMQFQAQTQHGARLFTVTQIEGDQVTVDGNHPLAGENLNFEVTIRGVRDASQEEKEHGHVHGPGGHHH